MSGVLDSGNAPDARPKTRRCFPSATADAFSASLILRPVDVPRRSFRATSGVLVLDAVSETKVSGSLDFSAVDRADFTARLRVQGRFRADYVGFCC